jgi:predicted DNA-binding protein
MKNKIKSTKTLTISMPMSLYEELESVASQDDRSKNYLVRKAIENLLKEFVSSKKK